MCNRSRHNRYRLHSHLEESSEGLGLHCTDRPISGSQCPSWVCLWRDHSTCVCTKTSRHDADPRTHLPPGANPLACGSFAALRTPRSLLDIPVLRSVTCVCYACRLPPAPKPVFLCLNNIVVDMAGLVSHVSNFVARDGGLHPPPEVLKSWPAPNHINPEERGWAAPVALVVVLVITFLVYFARIWARTVISKSAGLDGYVRIYNVVKAVY